MEKPGRNSTGGEVSAPPPVSFGVQVYLDALWEISSAHTISHICFKMNMNLEFHQRSIRNYVYIYIYTYSVVV